MRLGVRGVERVIQKSKLALQRGDAMALRRDEIVVGIELGDAFVPISGRKASRRHVGRPGIACENQFQMSEFAFCELRGSALSKLGDGGIDAFFIVLFLLNS